tara:strand:+ start:2327 stop:2551 length:225 start_codon:yes stop_codon:yes gene_type:complete
MPLYSYKCSFCGVVDEYIIDIEKRNKTFPCEQEVCTGLMIRELEAPSFQLKGVGWYKDGYSKPAPKSKSKEEKK